ncbi:MAG: dynamin family protein, partial [Brachymonas sp.]|nr:dynamin family protein [Brachymonas sp.]
QRKESARILGVEEDRVMTVSAQKGLLAKVSGDDELLKRSHLDQLEDMLGRQIIQRRHAIMHARLVTDAQSVRQQVQRLLDVRASELTEQMAELNGLQGKNDVVVRHQRMRVAKEQEGFELSVGRAHGMRSVHQKQLKQIYALLGSNQLLKETAVLNSALRESGFIKMGVKKAYTETFERLGALLHLAEEKSGDMHEMFANMFKQFNTEYGFTLQADAPPKLKSYAKELADIEAS